MNAGRVEHSSVPWEYGRDEMIKGLDATLGTRAGARTGHVAMLQGTQNTSPVTLAAISPSGSRGDL